MPRVETFANLRIYKSVLFWRPVKMYFLGVCVKFWQKWKIGPETHKNEFIYLAAKVYTHEFFSAKRPRNLIHANVFEATRRPPNFVPRALSTLRNMCGPWGFYPLMLLSLGAFIRRDFFGGAFVRGAFVRGAFVRGAFVRGAFVRGAFVRGGPRHSLLTSVLNRSCVSSYI